MTSNEAGDFEHRGRLTNRRYMGTMLVEGLQRMAGQTKREETIVSAEKKHWNKRVDTHKFVEGEWLRFYETATEHKTKHNSTLIEGIDDIEVTRELHLLKIRQIPPFAQRQH